MYIIAYVAQLVRVLDWKSLGHRFESYHRQFLFKMYYIADAWREPTSDVLGILDKFIFVILSTSTDSCSLFLFFFFVWWFISFPQHHQTCFVRMFFWELFDVVVGHSIEEKKYLKKYCLLNCNTIGMSGQVTSLLL